MKTMSKLLVILSFLAFPLVGCGTEADDALPLEGTEDEQGAEEASFDPVSDEEGSELEQAIEIGRYTSCKSHARPFAGCGRDKKVWYGCTSSDLNAHWVKTRTCLGCNDKGSWVTCWF